ncbi:sulfur carrier protein ThiS [Ectobacillus ponti]|uniref:Sulfur carrier protein ThiS n=1 Tax=Ectobacillus ponti TaxID=2961894 RepID=A0AA41X6K2_9BACI|nr:sulfur carrier protein ThiS [Ectobacillus ponti]MCP8968133.1 sulfur carrier protein ThiS [Ectobacillus ponti]
MLLQINGRKIEVPEEIGTVEQLLGHFGLEGKIVVVEQNGSIVEKQQHRDTSVFAGDQIEIVTFVGGG